MSNKKSKSDLLEFLDYLARKGLMNKTTAASRKAAVNNVLGILNDEEATDISKIDLDDIMRRFSNLNGMNYTSDSLATYKSRVRSAIEDFLKYVENPMSFRPGIGNSTRRGSERARSMTTEPRNQIVPARNQAQERAPQLTSTSTATLVLPIPVRIDLTVYIQGLPHDLTQAEALRISNVIRAMAIET